jgi:pimeloyl-ACP methyl ester carboxylesterase
MAAAIEQFLATHAYDSITLIGFSGGGVLAMLLAERLKQTETVVTIAANLDISAWADHHGYTRLRGSLNPATQPALPPHIRQIHIAGGRDLQVPAHLSQSTALRGPNAQFLIVPEFSHRCCWESHWPAVLTRLAGTEF